VAEPGACDCQVCPALGELCAGCGGGCAYRGCSGDCAACPACCARRRDLDAWLAAVGGLALDAPLAPQPAFDPSSPSGQALPPFFPQLSNEVRIASAIAREPAVAVALDKVLTPRGRVSRRAIPARYGTYRLRAQWGVADQTFLVCSGNCLDDYLERLWAAQAEGADLWGQVRAMGFDAATSLNFSIYFDRPRLEHLLNIKRSWLTVGRMQATSALVPIPHLQWYQPLDLERQLRYAQTRGFHTLTMNLQIVKRRAWEPIAAGLPLIRRQAPELRFLFAGVVALKRMAELAGLFPGASFTNVTAQYLAQRRVRLQRDGTRLIKERVDGHPDLILAENVRLYRDFLAETVGQSPSPGPPAPPAEGARLYAVQQEIAAALQGRFGYSTEQAWAAAERLAVDEAILAACREWLETGALDYNFQGAFPGWPCAESAPYPTLGELLHGGSSPLDAFLRLASLAGQVDGEIQALVGRSGY